MKGFVAKAVRLLIGAGVIGGVVAGGAAFRAGAAGPAGAEQGGRQAI